MPLEQQKQISKGSRLEKIKEQQVLKGNQYFSIDVHFWSVLIQVFPDEELEKAWN